MLLRLPRAGVEVAATQAGSGALVLFLHGQPGARGDWDAVIAELGGEGHAVALDRPGYGESRVAARGLAENAAISAEVVEELGAGAAVVVGHSWAGGVALALAAARPDLVAGLVLAASIGTLASVGRADRVLAAPLVGPALSRGTLVAGAAALRIGPIRRRVPGASRLPHAAVTGLARDLVRGRTAAAFTIEQRALVREIAALDARIETIEAPARVLAGEDDVVVAPAVSAELAARLPAAELVRIPRAGHVLPLQAPGVVADAVRALLPG